MAAFEPGSIVIVPFPYSDRLSEKRRPAVVVSAPDVEARGLLWIAMVTTARAGLQPDDIPIDDPAAAGLRAACLVRPLKIACIEPKRILRQVGRLPPPTAGLVFDRVRSFVAPTSARS